MSGNVQLGNQCTDNVHQHSTNNNLSILVTLVNEEVLDTLLRIDIKKTLILFAIHGVETLARIVK